MQHRVLACRALTLSLTRSRTVSSPGNIDRQTFVFTAHMHEGVHVQKKACNGTAGLCDGIEHAT